MVKSKPINNIYWIPIEDLHFLECVDEPPAVGVESKSVLIEGSNPANARLKAMKYPGFYKNWKKLTPEEKQMIRPFRFNQKVKISKIEKVLFCQLRFKARDESYTCGRPIHDIEGHIDQHDRGTNINGEFGMCCITGYDVPDGLDCPYKKADYIKPDYQ